MPDPRSCPACRATMDRRVFQRVAAGALELDLCWDCHGIWFDPYESTQLTPASVIELFRLIHEHRDKPARALSESMRCPACSGRLVLTQDLQRTNRISYYRCDKGHGRFTAFYQFLREKQFVRSLSPLEIDQLRVSVKQVRCSGCGAGVDLATASACAYCRMPVSILDADAVEKALAGLNGAERRRTQRDPAEIGKAFEALIATHRKPARESPWTRGTTPMQTSSDLADLLLEGIADLFDR